MTQAGRQHEVAIVGFGPSGAALAGWLGRLGRRVLVLEREREVYRLPRAVHFDHEVMRIFQSLGLADAIRPHTRVIPKCEFWNARRELLFETRLDRDETDQGWASDYMFHQPSLERILRDSAVGRAGIDVSWGALTGLVAKDDGVELRFDAEDGSAQTTRAHYVVGCDGAASLVRKAAGFALEDLAFDEPWVVVDVRGADGLPGNCIQLCDPARPTTLVPCADGLDRFEFMLKPGESDEQMLEPATLRGLLSAWLDPARIEIVRAAVYRFHAIVASEWWRGRIGIAGDAAHQTPPFLGQGMCAGIRDAANLAWKLDLVLRGDADAGLLESYASERAPHVRAFIERAVAAGKLICTQDEATASARDAAIRAQRERGDFAPVALGLPQPGPGLWQADPHPQVGRLAPQPRVRRAGGEALLDDVTGARFRLILRDERGWPDAARRRALGELGGMALVWSDEPGRAPEGGLRVQDARGRAGEFFSRHALHAFLVRPDHATFGVAASPEDVGGLVDALVTSLRRESGAPRDGARGPQPRPDA